jgi:hypothetical protein
VGSAAHSVILNERNGEPHAILAGNKLSRGSPIAMSHTSAEYDHLDSLLRDWGAWQERHSEDVILPQQAAFCMIVSDQPAGSRILCADMSKSVYLVHCAQLTLPLRYQTALFVWYAIQMKDGGGYWTPDEKASILSLSVSALRMRVTRARRVLMRKYPGLAAFGTATRALRKRRRRDKSSTLCEAVSRAPT